MSTIQITPYFAIESGSTVTVMKDDYIVVLKGAVYITRAGGSVSRPAQSPSRNLSTVNDPDNLGYKNVEADIAATSTARSRSTQSPNGSDMTSCMREFARSSILEVFGINYEQFTNMKDKIPKF